jgi:hypothetical protein
MKRDARAGAEKQKAQHVLGFVSLQGKGKFWSG